MNTGAYTILEIQKKYYQEIDIIDLDFLIGHIIKKEREFILAHPDFEIQKNQFKEIVKLIKRRKKNEPLAYLLGYKEFYSLNFKVNKYTLIPRPETEIIIEKVLEKLESFPKKKPLNIIDIGTGSGNIIVTLAKNLIPHRLSLKFYGVDLSREAVKIARENSKTHRVKIKFIAGDLASPIIKSNIIKPNSLNIITANLPYLSKEIYNNCLPNVKKYEPKSALFSSEKGLQHYHRLLKQIQLLIARKEADFILFFEISPEQKNQITLLIRKHLPQAKISFYKDLAKKWRVVEIKIT